MSELIVTIETKKEVTSELVKNESIIVEPKIGHFHANKAILDTINETIMPDKHFVHTQNIASDIWEINHNLGKYPAITIVDSAGTLVVGEILYLSLNSVRITFIGGFAGKAYFN